MLREEKEVRVVMMSMPERSRVHLSSVLDKVTPSEPAELGPAEPIVCMNAGSEWLCVLLLDDVAWTAYAVVSLLIVSFRDYDS